ncbi:MAG: ATP-binding protein [Pseudomonadota bacterium]
MLAKFATALCAVALLATGTARGQAVTSITQVEMLGSETDQPPLSTEAWQAGELPYFQGFLAVDQAPTYQWLRFYLPAAAPGEKQALFIARHMRNVDIYVNGQRLHQERDTARDYIGWNTPLLLELQPATLDRPRNEIVLGLQKSVGSSYLNTVQVGSYSAIAALYRSAYFNQLQIPLAAMISSIILGALAFGIWLTRRQHTEYLYYCASCAAWACVMVFMLLPYPLLLNLKHWVLLSYLNINLAGLCLAAFITKVLELSSLRWLHRIIGTLAAILLVLAVLPAPVGIAVALPMTLVTLGALAWAGQKTFVLLGKRANRKVQWVAASLLLMLLMPLIDLVNYLNAIINDTGFAGTTLSQFSFPFSLGILFIHIVHQLWSALTASERMNRELVERVQAATTELELNLQERHQLQLQESAQQERQKIYRDLHDDVGAKLTSILHASDNTRQKQMARAALDSLRETIHHANYQQQSMHEFIEAAADEMQIRLHAAGIAFHGPGKLSLPPRQLTSAESYHLTRALREITNNILHHSRASTVAFTAAFTIPGGYQLEIADDGCGFQADPNGKPLGNGLANVRQRLHDIGGHVRWQSSAGKGCLVTVKLLNAG